jgi:MFS family permease
MGLWVVNIPAVEDQAGISHAVLGRLLLVLGAGAFAGMQFAGPLLDRFGTRVMVPVSAALCSAALVLPALAGDAWTLGGAMFALGFGNGCLDASMNVHAVQVERGYGRPVMSAFHAVFSVGGLLASLAGAWTISVGLSTAATFAGVGVLGLAVTLAAAPGLLRQESPGVPSPTVPESSLDSVAGVPTPPAPASPGNTEPGNAEIEGVTSSGSPRADASGRRGTARRVWALAVLALVLMLCEGVAYDWSVLDVEDVMGAPAATAALAYGAFATAMTVGRLVVDRVAARFGPVAVVRVGALLAAVALTAVSLTPWIWLAIAGWAIFGVGLSGCVPQLFSAAGHADPESAGVNMSRVAGLGYVGILAGPAVIGFLTEIVPLNVAFLLPAALCVVAAGAAGILRSQAGAAPASALREARTETS